MNSRLKKCLESKAVLTLLAIVIAFFVGAIVLFAAGVNPILAYTTLLKNILGDGVSGINKPVRGFLNRL